MQRNDDFIVVGGGIIGIAVALEVRRRNLGTVTLLEKEERLGVHASGRNSGVLHAGIYYSSDSMKARLCADGARRLREYAGERGLPLRRCGKVIVATSPETESQIDVLYERAVRNGVRVERITPGELREIEPEARTHGRALHSPDTSVTDPLAVLRALGSDAAAAGVRMETGVAVLEVDDSRSTVVTTAGNRGYGVLVNCAGLHADRIARSAGVGRAYDVLPFKGMYRAVAEPMASRFNGCVYPAPDLRVPFLGVHVTPTVDGGITLGPTALPVLGREHYRGIRGIRPREAVRVGMDLARMFVANRQGFRRMALQEAWRYGHPGFVAEARRLAPGLRGRDVGGVVKAGIRAQLVERASLRLVMDFVVEAGRRSVHVLNAVSPGFTSALPFAELVVDRAEEVR